MLFPHIVASHGSEGDLIGTYAYNATTHCLGRFVTATYTSISFDLYLGCESDLHLLYAIDKRRDGYACRFPVNHGQ